VAAWDVGRMRVVEEGAGSGGSPQATAACGVGTIGTTAAPGRGEQGEALIN